MSTERSPGLDLMDHLLIVPILLPLVTGARMLG